MLFLEGIFLLYFFLQMVIDSWFLNQHCFLQSHLTNCNVVLFFHTWAQYFKCVLYQHVVFVLIKCHHIRLFDILHFRGCGLGTFTLLTNTFGLRCFYSFPENWKRKSNNTSNQVQQYGVQILLCCLNSLGGSVQIINACLLQTSCERRD